MRSYLVVGSWHREVEWGQNLNLGRFLIHHLPAFLGHFEVLNSQMRRCFLSGDEK
jgi:hypothetical protein